MTDRLLLGVSHRHPISVSDHLALHGRLPDVGSQLIAEVTDAGLRGRGGGGFPAGIKLAAVADGPRPIVVVNGTEGEPMSSKDHALLTHVPHLVLDGAQAAACAVGAREILVSAAPGSNQVLAHAIAERGQRRRRGQPRFKLVARARGYVAGEETAVIAHLEGRPARPRVTPPRPAESGYRRRPTLVQNVETLAHIGLIARHGAAWFREQGTADRPGTMLVTVTGAIKAPGVYEVPVGTTLSDVTAGAGGVTDTPQALLVGGYFGAWVTATDNSIALNDQSLRAHRAAVGAGVIVAIGARSCPVAETSRLTAYLASESAGQCGPCVNGLGALAGVLDRFATGRTSAEDGERLLRWIDMIQGRGACAHPDGVSRMLNSAIELFRSEFEEHARHGPCERCNQPPLLHLPARQPTADAA